MSTYFFDRYVELVKIINEPSMDSCIWEKDFKLFSDELVEYCTTENIFSVYRVLRRLENDLKVRTKYMVYGLTGQNCQLYIEQLSNVIAVEKEIIELRISNPPFQNITTSEKKIPKLLKWTDTKIALVELIYAISSSINNGNASIKDIRNCLEFVFQIDIGSYCYDGFEDILLRKNKPARYLVTLIHNLENHITRIISK